MSIQRRREHYMIIQEWKITNSEVPTSTAVRFREIDRLGIRAIIPSLQRTAQCSTQTDNDLYLASVQLWNTLHKQSEALDRFITNLRQSLHMIPDNSLSTNPTPPELEALLSIIIAATSPKNLRLVVARPWGRHPDAIPGETTSQCRLKAKSNRSKKYVLRGTSNTKVHACSKILCGRPSFHCEAGLVYVWLPRYS